MILSPEQGTVDYTNVGEQKMPFLHVAALIFIIIAFGLLFKIYIDEAKSL